MHIPLESWQTGGEVQGPPHGVHVPDPLHAPPGQVVPMLSGVYMQAVPEQNPVWFQQPVGGGVSHAASHMPASAGGAQLPAPSHVRPLLHGVPGGEST